MDEHKVLEYLEKGVASGEITEADYICLCNLMKDAHNSTATSDEEESSSSSDESDSSECRCSHCRNARRIDTRI